MNEILKYDKDFSESKFITYVNNIFIQIYTSLITKEIKNIKHFVTDEVYIELENKINYLNQQHLNQMYDELNVASTSILSSRIENNLMVIEVKIISKYLDYLVDLDGNYVSGNQSFRISKNNYLTFIKKINFKETGVINKCPSCGASIDVNATGVCSYCGNVYNLKDKNWILSSMKVV